MNELWDLPLSINRRLEQIQIDLLKVSMELMQAHCDSHAASKIAGNVGRAEMLIRDLNAMSQSVSIARETFLNNNR